MARGCVIFLISGMLMLVTVSSACACSCMSPATVDEAMDKSAAVFLGTVIAIVPLDGRYPVGIEQPVAVTLAVRESWKGPQTATITLYTVINGISCNGYFWEEQADFLVYAHRAVDGRLGVGLCSRTVEGKQAAADLQVLGAGQIPPTPAAPAGPIAAPAQEARLPWLLMLVGGAALSGLIGLVLVQRRRRQ
jgi:hypothetical protein